MSDCHAYACMCMYMHVDASEAREGVVFTYGGWEQSDLGPGRQTGSLKEHP